MNYDVVRAHAQSAHDNFLKCGDQKHFSNFRNEMNNFYYEGMENPSVAKTIMWSNVIRPNYFKNQQKLDSDKKITKAPKVYWNPFYQKIYEAHYKTAQAITKGLTNLAIKAPVLAMMSHPAPVNKRYFDSKYKELYPKTHAVRDRLIETGRVTMGKVQKKSTSWRQKVITMASSTNLMNNYPKTALARITLFFDNRIQDNKVTPKMKFWQKFKYAKLFK